MITVTDMFCGAGGSSQGAAAAGAEIRIAANHWQLAVESHNTNFPDTDHDCADVSQVLPQRWPRTTGLWASPECPYHSGAAGRKKWNGQVGMFDNFEPDPSAVRSRATMWDVPRFAEFHNYQFIIVENVVEVRKWRLFDAWLQAMTLLDYDYKLLYLNSQFFGVPQSRDRFYGVFWKKTINPPDLDYRPWAMCSRCGEVQAVQSWKNDRHFGKYGERSQYLYRCPTCASTVEPYQTPALVAIDWADPGSRIGDRDRPLKSRTMERIKAGLEKYGHQSLVIEVAYSNSDGNRAMPTTMPLRTQTARQTHAVTLPPSAVIVFRRIAEPQSPDDVLTTITSGGINHGVVRAPFILNMRGNDGYARGTTVDNPLPSITTSPPFGAIGIPWLSSYYGGKDHNRDVGQPMGTLSTVDRHAIVQAETPKIEDCYFRMLKPPEIGLGMAFAPDYVVLGNQRDQVRQYGNAVTPPVAQWLFKQVTKALA